MKRIISLLLVLALCLSLCACGKSKAVSNVESLIGAIGEVTADSEAAVVEAEEAYKVLTDKEKKTVENYADLVSARTVLDEALEIERFRQSILGEWVNIDSGEDIVSFEKGGNCLFDNITATYNITDEVVSVSVLGMELQFTLEKDEEEIHHLCLKDGADYVRQEDWEHFQPEAVAITTENWSEYFEIRECTEMGKNPFGEYTDVRTGFGLFLKDVYLGKLSRNSQQYPSNVSFEVQYLRGYKVVTLDKNTGEFSFSEENCFSEFTGLETAVIQTWDCRTFEDENIPVATMAPTVNGESTWEYVEDYMASYFGAMLVSYEGASDGTFFAQALYQSPDVLRSTGTIYLNP